MLVQFAVEVFGQGATCHRINGIVGQVGFHRFEDLQNLIRRTGYCRVFCALERKLPGLPLHDMVAQFATLTLNGKIAVRHSQNYGRNLLGSVVSAISCEITVVMSRAYSQDIVSAVNCVFRSGCDTE
jgi:hypothetical protein